jgi:hypothetical protein
MLSAWQGSYTQLHSPAPLVGQARSVVEFEFFLILAITKLRVVFHFNAQLPIVVPNRCTTRRVVLEPHNFVIAKPRGTSAGASVIYGSGSSASARSTSIVAVA